MYLVLLLMPSSSLHACPLVLFQSLPLHLCLSFLSKSFTAPSPTTYCLSLWLLTHFLIHSIPFLFFSFYNTFLFLPTLFFHCYCTFPHLPTHFGILRYLPSSYNTCDFHSNLKHKSKHATTKTSFLYRVTQEYRENLAKVAKSTCEQYKQSLRKTRQKGMSDIRKNKKGKSQDDAKMVEKMVTTKNW